MISEEKISKANDVIFNGDSTPVVNNIKILNWMADNITKTIRNNQKPLSATLIDEFTSLFGSPNKIKKFEFLTRVWILKYNDLIFNVYSAKTKGTSIEIIGYSYDDIRSGKRQKDIILFLEKLSALVNKI